MNRKIRICTARACEDCGSKDLLKDALRHAENRPHVTVEKRYCMGTCEQAPNVQVVDEEGNEIVRHTKVTPKEMQRIVEEL